MYNLVGIQKGSPFSHPHSLPQRNTLPPFSENINFNFDISINILNNYVYMYI